MTKDPQPVDVPEVRIDPRLQHILSRASSHWDQLQERHRDWLARFGTDPLYYLPEAAIGRLEKPRLGHPPLLDEAAAAGERGLLAACRLNRAVGYSAGCWIKYPYLPVSRPGPVGREDFPDPGWTEAQWKTAIAFLETKADETHNRLKGYVGWLATETPFLDGLQALQKCWKALPDDQRPAFPLRRPGPALRQVGETLVPASEQVAAFANDLETFLDRWGLLGLATWDLPEPQGPLVPCLLQPGSPALPRHGLHIALPVHYPLTGDDDLLNEILNQQRQIASSLGLDRTAAGLPHHKAYATIFEIVHWERVITGRYGRGKRPKGFVGLVVEAVAEAIEREITLVAKWRKAVSACRRGKRAHIKALRVPAH